ncbi:hypothetical protein AB0L06_18040 [Spirillospora sp. NPDC052269]
MDRGPPESTPPAANDVNDYLALEPSLVQHRSSVVVLEGGFDQIVLDGISSDHRDAGKRAIEHLSLTIYPSEVVAFRE